MADGVDNTAEELPRECLRELEQSPSTHSLPRGLQVVNGLARGLLDDATVRDALARIHVTTPGTALIAATLDRRAQEIASPHADALARMIAADDDDPWWAQLEALWRVHELAYDGRALVAATRRLLVHDRYHRRTLQMAMRAAQIANEPIDAIDADLAVADVLLGPYTRLVERPDQWQSVIAELPLPHLRRALAWRVLQRVELDKPPAQLGAWAIEQMLTSNEAEAFMALVEEVASGTFVEELWHTLFDPEVPESYVMPLLGDTHATRIARAMVTTQLRHPDGNARHAANEVLRALSHRGVETYVVDALTEYAVRYAAVRGAGGPLLGNGQTIASQLEDLVASLYAALANMATPSARAALIERLFAERRAYSHLASALATVWDDALHAEILAQLVQRSDTRAAGAYAFALREVIGQRAALLELTRRIVDWQGDSEVTRGYLHYALVVGMLAALDAGDIELVRRAHDAASWIADPALEPDAHARGRAWQNPLDEAELQATVARAIGPAVEPTTVAQPAAAPTPAPPTATPEATKPTTKPRPTTKPATPKAAKPAPSKKPKAAKPASGKKPKAAKRVPGKKPKAATPAPSKKPAAKVAKPTPSKQPKAGTPAPSKKPAAKAAKPAPGKTAKAAGRAPSKKRKAAAKKTG